MRKEELKGENRIDRRTVAGISQRMATKSQMRPLRTKKHVSKFGASQRETQPSHLFPENAFQTSKRVAFSETKAEQANEHDEK
jgi:hypothetical protein